MVQTRNIKVSLKISLISLNNASTILNENNISFKQYPNFVSFKHLYSFVLFKPSLNQVNHINVSQLTSREDISKAIAIVEDLLGVRVLSEKIDNIVSTSTFKSNLDLYHIVKKSLFNHVRYNPEQFPGLFAQIGGGTVILFHSGKIVIVGSKSLEDTKWIVREVRARLRTLF